MIKDVIKVAEEKMQKTIQFTFRFITMKAVRANTTMLDRIQVDYYGSHVIKSICQCIAPNQVNLVITQWKNF